MVQVVVFMLVLVAVYALKAVAVSRTHDDLVRKSTMFSWAAARPQDEATAASWAEEEPESVTSRQVRIGSAARLRHVGA